MSVGKSSIHVTTQANVVVGKTSDVHTQAPVLTSGGCESYRPLITQYNWDGRIMMAIMQAENSSCDTNKNNMSAGETHRDLYGNVVCVGSYGLLQVGCLHFSNNQNPNDPKTNIGVAYQVWQRQGYRAWTMYRNGEYLKYLK